MLIPTMDFARLVVHDKRIEQQKVKKICRELNKRRAEDGNLSKARFKVQDNPMFEKRFSNQRPPNTPKVNKIKLYTPKTQERKSSCSYVEKPLFASLIENMMESA